ncbi:hypothetical protein DV515_00009094 [Chloebia gouldiae]|uniref:Uncharacterized protein n=1 Tax=Chloebia gouldiae TaxID=44316 RepID=A0A3L8SCT8_CHLGU|nr:hypothetical protein DV515_00009094 [Chloebia gouldiae]
MAWEGPQVKGGVAVLTCVLPQPLQLCVPMALVHHPCLTSLHTRSLLMASGRRMEEAKGASGGSAVQSGYLSFIPAVLRQEAVRVW